MTTEPRFPHDVSSGDLRRRSARAGTVAVAGQAGQVLLNLAALAILGRLLTPGDFGLIAMVLAIIGSTAMLQDLGLSAATVQQPQIGHRQVSTLFWVNAAAGALLAVFVAAGAPLIARFYGEPRLLGVTQALAALSLLGGLSIQHQALLRRQLRFGVLTAVDLLALAAGNAMAIACAWLGARYWALVIMHLTLAGSRTALVWLASGWRPRGSIDLREVRPLLAFGRLLTGSRMVAHLTHHVDRILIGKFAGASPLGLYEKAHTGAVAPFEQASWSLTRVAVSTLSRLQQEPARFRAYFRTALLLVAAGALPLLVFLIVDAEPAVRIVLGDQWLGAVPLVRLLAPVAAAKLLDMANGWIFISLGRPDRMLRWRLVEGCVTMLALAAGVRWGAAGVAAGLLIASGVLAWPGIVYCFRGSPLAVRDVAAAGWRPLAAAVVAAVALGVLRSLWPVPTGLVAGFLLDGAVLGSIYLGVWVLLPGGRATLRQLADLGSALRPHGGAGV